LRNDSRRSTVVVLRSCNRLLHSIVANAALVSLGLNGNSCLLPWWCAQDVHTKVARMRRVVNPKSFPAENACNPRLKLPTVHVIDLREGHAGRPAEPAASEPVPQHNRGTKQHRDPQADQNRCHGPASGIGHPDQGPRNHNQDGKNGEPPGTPL
jgi:hypothetical protein